MTSDDSRFRPVGPSRVRCPVELAVPSGRKKRVERLVERAEVLFVRRVTQDGGMDSWRHEAERRIRTARDACAQGRLARTETAALVVALVDVPLRDACAWLVADDPDPAWAALWLHLVRHAPPPFRSEPLFLLGWTAWRLGDLPVATVAVTEAHREDPGHRAAALLARLLAGAGDRHPVARRRGA